MVSALRELQESVARAKVDLQEALERERGLLRVLAPFIIASEDMAAASYWMGKVRTDVDYQDAQDMYDDATGMIPPAADRAAEFLMNNYELVEEPDDG